MVKRHYEMPNRYLADLAVLHYWDSYQGILCYQYSYMGVPDSMKASKKVRSPSSLRRRFCSTSMSCRVPFSRKWRTNWLAVLLLKKDKSNSLMCLKRSRNMSSFLVATIAATASAQPGQPLKKNCSAQAVLVGHASMKVSCPGMVTTVAVYGCC